ncbi:uncharacterized protein LOC111085651 [Limulus polyphemus]|uniref:Uncharacterized protein LOC111085651 n=1 Tax=Limulus polyphemus TaxID=6850 RepID=A0ABM1SBE8_LIMPO|nr:uncharacterized protein LOC111085651 [Limulus polyphemus]
MRKYMVLFHIMCLCCCLPRVSNNSHSFYESGIDNTNKSNGDNDLGLLLDNSVNRHVGHNWFSTVQHKKRSYQVNKRHITEGLINSDLTALNQPSAGKNSGPAGKMSKNLKHFDLDITVLSEGLGSVKGSGKLSGFSPIVSSPYTLLGTRENTRLKKSGNLRSYKMQELSNKVLNALSHIQPNEQQTTPSFMATALQSNTNYKNRHSMGFDIGSGIYLFGLDHAVSDLLGKKNTLVKYLCEDLIGGPTENIVRKHDSPRNVKRTTNFPKYNSMSAARLEKKTIKVYDLEFPQQNEMVQESKNPHNKKKITENEKITYFPLFTRLREKQRLDHYDENSQSAELNRLFLSNFNHNGNFCDLKTCKTHQEQTNTLPVKKLFYSRGWGPGGEPLKMRTTYSLEDENPEIRVIQSKPNDDEVSSPSNSYFPRHRLGKWKVGHLFGPYW